MLLNYFSQVHLSDWTVRDSTIQQMIQQSVNPSDGFKIMEIQPSLIIIPSICWIWLNLKNGQENLLTIQSMQRLTPKQRMAIILIITRGWQKGNKLSFIHIAQNMPRGSLSDFWSKATNQPLCLEKRHRANERAICRHSEKANLQSWSMSIYLQRELTCRTQMSVLCYDRPIRSPCICSLL